MQVWQKQNYRESLAQQNQLQSGDCAAKHENRVSTLHYRYPLYIARNLQYLLHSQLLNLLFFKHPHFLKLVTIIALCHQGNFEVHSYN